MNQPDFSKGWPYKDTIDLLKANKAFFGSMLPWVDSQAVTRVAESRKRYTFIFAQPRTGSTLLLRLMNLACLSPMVGDHPPEFYQSLINLYKVFKTTGQYNEVYYMLDNFTDEYRGSNKEREKFVFESSFGHLLFKRWGYGYAKSTIIGFGNDMVEEFSEILRDYMVDRGHEVKIVWLTRDHDDIINSMNTCKGVSVEPENFKRLLEEQRSQFKSAAELGDVHLTYDGIVKNPYDTLIKLNPLYHPNRRAVERVMTNKVREK